VSAVRARELPETGRRNSHNCNNNNQGIIDLQNYSEDLISDYAQCFAVL